MKKFLSFIFVLMFATSLVSCFNSDDDDDVDNDNGNGITADQYESNNTWQDAVSIELDTLYSATINEKTDDDFFTFTTAHSSTTYDVVAISVTEVSNTMSAYLKIFDNSGTELATSYSSTEGADYLYRVAMPGGTYIVRFSGGWAQVDHFNTGSYSFEISNEGANDANGGGIGTGNHVIDNAADITLGASFNGVIVSKYENDFYKITNPNPEYWETFTISFTDVSDGLQIYITLYDSAQGEINSYYAGSAGADYSYTFATKETELYLRVCGGWDQIPNFSTGSYTLVVTDNDANDDYEPDDTFATARPITGITAVESTYTGTILTNAENDNGGDYEYFLITIPQDTVGEPKKVQMSIDPEAANTELHFNSYYSNQTAIPNGSVDGDDGQTIGINFLCDDSADYQVYVKLGAFVGDNGNYTISFSLIDE